MRGYLEEEMNYEVLTGKKKKQLLMTRKKTKPIKLLGQALLFGKKGKNFVPHFLFSVAVRRPCSNSHQIQKQKQAGLSGK